MMLASSSATLPAAGRHGHGRFCADAHNARYHVIWLHVFTSTPLAAIKSGNFQLHTDS